MKNTGDQIRSSKHTKELQNGYVHTLTHLGSSELVYQRRKSNSGFEAWDVARSIYVPAPLLRRILLLLLLSIGACARCQPFTVKGNNLVTCLASGLERKNKDGQGEEKTI